jgi:hypothetical protein
MNTRMLRRVRRLFNTGLEMDRYNRLEWIRAVRVVRGTRNGWIAERRQERVT